MIQYSETHAVPDEQPVSETGVFDPSAISADASPAAAVLEEEMSPSERVEAKRYGQQQLRCEIADQLLDLAYLGAAALFLAVPFVYAIPFIVAQLGAALVLFLLLLVAVGAALLLIFRPRGADIPHAIMLLIAWPDWMRRVQAACEFSKEPSSSGMLRVALLPSP